MLEQKGFPEGKLPKNKELHHVKQVKDGGKTTVKNTKVMPEKEHIELHKKRRKRGGV